MSTTYVCYPFLIYGSLIVSGWTRTIPIKDLKREGNYSRRTFRSCSLPSVKVKSRFPKGLTSTFDYVMKEPAGYTHYHLDFFKWVSVSSWCTAWKRTYCALTLSLNLCNGRTHTPLPPKILTFERLVTWKRTMRLTRRNFYQFSVMSVFPITLSQRKYTTSAGTTIKIFYK